MRRIAINIFKRIFKADIFLPKLLEQTAVAGILSRLTILLNQAVRAALHSLMSISFAAPPSIPPNTHTHTKCKHKHMTVKEVGILTD